MRVSGFVRTHRKELLPFVVSLALIAIAARGQVVGDIPEGGPPIEIRVHANAQHTAPISNTIFGSFLEPIGHSTYGGLWAELLENPSFEPGLWTASNAAQMLRERPELARATELDLPLPWEPLDSHQGNRYEPHRVDAANSLQSVLLLGLPHREVGVRQRIYLPVHRELRFAGSIWAKHLSGPAKLDISLRERNHPAHVLARAAVDANNAEWTRYAFTLELQRGQVQPLEPVDFVIAVEDDARAFIDQVSLMPADNLDGLDPDVVAMARELQTPLVRFGGNFTSAYHWRDGVGRRDKRVSMLNLSWGIPEYDTFGTDEFLHFCELIHAQPQIALNLGTGTAQEAAEWVRYVNQHWGDRKGGLLWEMGNELWGDWNVGYPPLEQIAARTVEFSRAIRQTDPAARLIATGQDEDVFREWNAQQLSTPPDTFNYLSTHFVVTTNKVELQHPSDDFVALSMLALPVGIEGRLHEMTQQIQQSSHKDAKIAFTEWLYVADEGRTDVRHAPVFTNLAGGLGTAGFLNMLMRNADTVPISDMTGILEFAGIWKRREQVYGAPGYWVLRMYAASHPSRLFPVDNTGPVYSVEKGTTRLPEIRNVPWLEVVAAQGDSPDKIVLFCLNRSLTRDLPSHIVFDGFDAAGSVRIETLTASSLYAQNSESTPEAVVPQESTARAGHSLDYTFPHSSVVVIHLQARK